MAKKKMKKSTKNALKVIISIIYIVWGILSPLTLIGAIISLNISAIISAIVGVLTLLAGIFGLFDMNKKKCRAFGIVIFVFSVVGAVMALPLLNWSSIINAILAWLFIICIK